MEKSTKYIVGGLSTVISGMIIYNIYGKEITTSGFKREDGTYYNHRICGATIGFVGALILCYGVYIKTKK